MTRLQSLITFLQALMRRSDESELGLIAAGVAFFSFLAVFPAAAVIISIWGLVADPVVIREELALMKDFLPAEAFVLLSAQIDTLLSANTRSLGWSTVVSTLLAFWAARAGMASFIQGLNAVHDLPQRSGFWHQVQALLMTLALVGLTLGAMLASVVVPLIITFLPLGGFAAISLELVNFVFAAILLVLAVGLAYQFGPNRQQKHPLFTWGLVIAMVLWAAASRGFVIYLANFGTYNQIYGSIGAVAALLMWIYLSVYALLLGAAFDAERAAQKGQ